MLLSILSSIHQFILSENGPTAVEYAVVAGVIVFGAFLAITAVGTALSNWFSGVGNFLANASTS